MEMHLLSQILCLGEMAPSIRTAGIAACGRAYQDEQQGQREEQRWPQVLSKRVGWDQSAQILTAPFNQSAIWRVLGPLNPLSQSVLEFHSGWSLSVFSIPLRRKK